MARRVGATNDTWQAKDTVNQWTDNANHIVAERLKDAQAEVLLQTLHSGRNEIDAP